MPFNESEAISAVADGVVVKPYYATREQIDALRLEIETVGPEKRKELEDLQRKASEEFINIFGDALSPEQIAYLRSDNVIICDPSFLSDLHEHFSRGIHQTSEATLIEGRQYISYRIHRPDHVLSASGSGEDFLGDWAIQLWAGRIPVAPLPVGFEHEPMGADLLIGLREFDEVYCAEDHEKFRKNLSAFAASRSWAGAVLHEKIHGIQRYDLPFPLLEIIAHYYSNETFVCSGLTNLGQYAFDAAHKWWNGLSEEFGTELHAFVFGNLSEPRASEIRLMLKDRLTHSVLKGLFDRGPYDDRVEWIAAEDV